MKNRFVLGLAFLFTFNSALSQTTQSSSAVALTKPVAPNYSACDEKSMGAQQAALCRQQMERVFQQQLAQYNAAVKQQEQQASALATGSALDSAKQAESANNSSAGTYQILQMVTMVASMAAFAKLPSCTGPHAPACTTKWTAIGIAMAGLSMLSGQQSSSNKASQYKACETANNVSTSQSYCGAAPVPYNPTNYPNNLQDTTYDPQNIVDSNGNCKASEDVCKQITDSLPPGTTLRDYKGGLSAFASGKAPIKVNPDGTITRTTDGKKFDPNSFSTQAGLVEAGLSPEAAQAALASLNKNNSSLADGSKSASGTGTAGGGAASSLFGDEGSGAGGRQGGFGVAVNGEASGLAGADADKNRSIASAEGLVRDFNGEVIGVQGDDIFKMMKRRYQLKEKQDSFMTSAGPATAAPSP